MSKAGPGLNVVAQLNPDVLPEATKADTERKKGRSLGPDASVPILLKDIIDATPMYTSAGDWALRESFPEKNSGVAKELPAHGVIILGKVWLSEWANSFGSQPSGFSNLTVQVLNANDTSQDQVGRVAARVGTTGRRCPRPPRRERRDLESACVSVLAPSRVRGSFAARRAEAG